MKRVLLFSHTTGYQLRAFDAAAAALGIELVFATDRCHKLDDPWQDRAVPVRFYDVEQSVDLVVRRARAFPVDGVIAVGDRPVTLAARSAAALGVRWHSVAGAQASADKRASRAAFAAAGLPSPASLVIPMPGAGSGPPPASGVHAAAARLSFPVVLKPLGLSGSRGVIRANDAAEFDAAFARIGALLARPQVRAARAGLEDGILAEQYIDGAEFAIEGVMTDGVLQVFAIFDKPDPLTGPFFEETIYVTPSRAPREIQARIASYTREAARALGLTHGPVHAECRVTPAGEVYMLEVAARPIGGLCSRVLTFDGRSLETVLLAHAAGHPMTDVHRDADAAAVMMIPIPRRGIYKGVTGEAAARAIPGITEIRITAKEGQLLEPLPEAGSYLGFIFARGSRPEDAEAAVRRAHAQLEFSIARELAVSSWP